MSRPWERFHFLTAYILSLLAAYKTACLLTPPRDMSQEIAEAVSKYPIPESILQPEPHEFLRYVLFWVFFAAIFTLLYNIPRLRRKIGPGQRFSSGAALALTAFAVSLFFYCLFKEEWDYTKTNTGRWYIQHTVMEWNPLLLFYVILCPAAVLILLRKYVLRRFPWLTDLRWRWLICGAMSAALILYAGLFAYKPNPFYALNGLYHDSYYLTSVYSIYNGGTIGVDADAVYGGHGYFLAPLLKIIGYSHHRCVFLLALICVWTFACLFYLAKAVGKTPEKTLFTFAFVLQIMVFFAFGAHGGTFFYQHVPHRVVFPAMTLVYIRLEKRFRRRGLYAAGGYLLSSLALIWNIETGLAALGAFYAVQILSVFSRHTPDKPLFWRGALLHTAGALTSVGGFFGGMWLIAFLRTGQSVPLSRFYATQFTFARLGYGMLPLPEGVSMYMPVFALVAFGVALVLFWLFRNTGKDALSENFKLAAALTVVSAISLVYYMGRTDARNLIPVLWPAQLLLCMFLSRLSEETVLARLEQLERLAVKLAVWPLCAVICLYVLSIPYTIASTPVFSSYIYAQRTHTMNARWQEELEFLQKWQDPAGTVNLVGEYGPILAAELGLRTTYLGECVHDLYDYRAYDLLIAYIDRISALGEPLLLDDSAIGFLQRYAAERYERLLEQRQYTLYESVQSLHVFLPAEGANGLPEDVKQ